MGPAIPTSCLSALGDLGSPSAGPRPTGLGAAPHFPCQHQMAQQEGREMDELMGLGDHSPPAPSPCTRQPWLCPRKSHHGVPGITSCPKRQHRPAARHCPTVVIIICLKARGCATSPCPQCHPHLLPLGTPLLPTPAVSNAGAAPRSEGAATGQRGTPAQSSQHGRLPPSPA